MYRAILFAILIVVLSVMAFYFHGQLDLSTPEPESKVEVVTKIHCTRIAIDNRRSYDFILCLNETGWLYNQTYLILPEGVNTERIMQDADSIRRLAVEEGWYKEEWDRQIFFNEDQN